MVYIVDFIDKDRFFYEDINNIEKLINDEISLTRRKGEQHSRLGN